MTKDFTPSSLKAVYKVFEISDITLNKQELKGESISLVKLKTKRSDNQCITG